MADRSTAEHKLIDRRTVLRAEAVLRAAGPALLRSGDAEAQPRPKSGPPMVIHAQVHAYAANTLERRSYRVPNWPAHVTGDEMVAEMDKVGVDGGIFISPFSMYRHDGSYAIEVQRTHPGRFAVDPDDPAVAGRNRRLEEDARHGRHPHYYDQRIGPRAGRPGPRPKLPRGRSL